MNNANAVQDSFRLKFSKEGRAVYISHLDLMRTMQRAFLRSEIPLKYSEGFNPHAIISIALPLSVSHESSCEFMDFKLREFFNIDEIPFRLNNVLPEGISIQKAYVPETKCKNIRWLDIEGVFEYDDKNTEDLIDELTGFFARKSIVITKKTKKGMGETDIAEAIRSMEFEAQENKVLLKATISAQEPTLNPDLLVSALSQLKENLVPDFASFKRVCAYDKDMKIFD